MNILLIEDDPQQSETLIATLGSHYPGSLITEIETESDLYSLVDDIKRGTVKPPNVVVADVMFPWTTAGVDPFPEPPQNVKQGGFSRAGVRCLQEFRGALGNEIPWVFFSVLEPDMIAAGTEGLGSPDTTVFLSKEIGIPELLRQLDCLTKENESNHSRNKTGKN